MDSKIKLSIIIVSWNILEDLKKCLVSLFKYIETDFEVIVIDNNSNDQTIDYLKAKYPLVKIIANKTNEGFAKANNQGIKIAQGEYLLFLNPDTYLLDEQSIPNALNYLAEHKTTLLTGNVLNIDQTNQVAVRKFPTLYSQVITLLKLNNLIPGLNKVYYSRNFDYNKLQQVDSVIGAFMLTSAQTIAQLNGFSEDFFVWFEEVDLCKRLHEINGQVVYLPSAKVVHTGGQSFKQVMTLERQTFFNQSLITFFKKHKPRWQTMILIALLPFNLSLTMLQQIFKIKKSDY